MLAVSLDDYLRWRNDFVALLDPKFYPAAWLDDQVASGEFMLFSCADSAILCSVRAYPSGLKEFHGQAAVGELSSIVSTLIPLAESYAKSIGCRYASIASREGWSREMRQHGYTLYQTEIRKVL
jgi:hypothetical protein